MADAPPMVSPMGIALPERTTVYHGAETSVVTPTKRGAAAADEAALQGQVGLDSLLRQQDAERLAREQAAKDAQEQAELARKQAEERARLEQERQDEIQAKVQAEARRRAEMERAANPEDFWVSRFGGNSPDQGKRQWNAGVARVVAALIGGLADNAWTRAGGQGASPVTQAIQGVIAENRAAEIQRFERSKEFVKLAREDTDRARDLRDEFLRDLDARHAVAQKVLAAKVGATAKRMGLPAAEAEAERTFAMAAQADARQIAKDQEFYARKTQFKAPTVTVNENKPGGQPPRAGRLDTEARADQKQGVAVKAELADLIEKSPKAWEEYRAAKARIASDENYRENLPYIGKIGVGISRSLGNMTSGFVGSPDPGSFGKTLSADAQKINALVQKHVAAVAAAMPGAETEPDIARIESELGIYGNDAPAMAAKLRKDADEQRRRVSDLERNVRFQDGAESPSEPRRDVGGVDELLSAGGALGSTAGPSQRARMIEDVVDRLRRMAPDDPGRPALEAERRRLILGEP